MHRRGRDPLEGDAMDPGSAAHRHSASKTRVNALMALRSIRGTGRRGYSSLPIVAFSTPMPSNGLVTPKSERCRILVDGVECVWREGQAFMFDETFIHAAENATDQNRIILFCDVERPIWD